MVMPGCDCTDMFTLSSITICGSMVYEPRFTFTNCQRDSYLPMQMFKYPAFIWTYIHLYQYIYRHVYIQRNLYTFMCVCVFSNTHAHSLVSLCQWIAFWHTVIHLKRRRSCRTISQILLPIQKEIGFKLNLQITIVILKANCIAVCYTHTNTNVIYSLYCMSLCSWMNCSTYFYLLY